ncbi:methyltransferase [Candidatus Woesearchaeota archaeon]|nr:methyltransferase [Candidatus Woesearchaeota archaeon]
MTDPVYPPLEDSQMLQYQVEKHAFGKVLDMGTGSGVQALSAARNDNVTSVLAVDISKKAIEHCKKNSQNSKITYKLSDLFSKVEGKFDTILFNPPYLPQDQKIRRRALEGGKKGYEVIQEFLEEANNYLTPDGIILLVFSSLSHKEKVEDILFSQMLEFEELGSKHLFFETLYVYLIKKSSILKELEKEEVTNISYFTKGKRGVIYKGKYKGEIVCIKVKRKESEAIERIKTEIKFIQALNRHGIGPTYLFSDEEFLVYRFIPGKYVEEFFETAEKEKIRKVLLEVLKQCFIMDKLGINKEEMHHPVKHVIIGKQIKLIDFERCHYTEDPKNVSQFMQYIMMNIPILKKKKINLDANKIIHLTKDYKNNIGEDSFAEILKYISNC